MGFSENWYSYSMLIITLLSFIMYGILAFQKTPIINSGSGISQTNCLNTSKYMTDILIAGGGSITNSNNFYCPEGYTALTTVFGGSTNNIQLCYKTEPNVCDQTKVITDVNITKMTDSTGKYLPIEKRCPSGIARTVIASNPKDSDSGLLLCGKDAEGADYGLCFTTASKKEVKSYIPNNGIKVVTVSSQATGDGETFCTNRGYPGYKADLSLPITCSGKYNYLCKKYIS
jgi:hypothetical protein